MSSIPGSGRYRGVGNGNTLQYSCLGNSMDWRSWRATVHGVTKSQKTLSIHTHEHYIYYCGRKSFRRNGVVLISRVQNAVLGCNLKNDRMISVCFQGKPFNITVIQVYAPTSDAEEAEVELFYEDLQDLLELTPQNDVLFIIGDWNAKAGSQEISQSNRQVWPLSTK